MDKGQKNIIDVVCLVGAVVSGLIFIMIYDRRHSWGQFLFLAVPAVFIVFVLWAAIKNHKDKL